MRAPRSFKVRSFKLLGWAGGLVALYAIAGFLVVPPIARSQLEARLAEALHRPVTVRAVRVNPFAPSIVVRGLTVRERQGEAELAGFDELYVNAAWTSIFRLAPMADEVTLVKPRLRVVRYPDGTYNFQDLIDEAAARPKSEGPPARFGLFNLRLVDGRIDFDDQAEGEKHTVTELRLGIPFISSVPRYAEIKVLPELSANVNGARFALAGDSLPFGRSYATHLNVDLDGFDLTRLARYLPFEARARLASALLDTRLVIAFEQPPGKAAELKVRGRAAVRKLSLLEADGRPALAWERLAVELNEVEPFLPRIDLKSVELDGANIDLRREQSGALNFARLGPAPASGEQESASSGEPLALSIDRIVARFERLRFTDQATAPAFQTALEKGVIEGSGFGLQGGKRSEWKLAAVSDAGETVAFSGGLAMSPFTADGRLEIAGGVLKRYQPYIGQAARLRVDDGSADLAFSFRWGSDGLKLDDGALALHGVRARLASEKQPFVRVRSLVAKGATVDVAARTAGIGELTIGDPALEVRRGEDGVLNLARIAVPATSDAPAATSAQPWRVDIARASLRRGAVTFEDLAVGEPVKLRIAPLSLAAEGLSTGKSRRARVSLRATVNRSGTLAASGRLGLQPLSVQLSVDAQSIGFVTLRSYIDDRVNVDVTSGALSAKGTASFEMPTGAPVRAAYRGDVNVTDFVALDKRSAQEILKWKSLSLGAVDFELDPLKVWLGEIALSDYYARVVLSSEGRLSLQDILVAQPAPAEPKPQPAQAPDLRIGRITVQGGNVNFSDFFIKPNYSANLTGVSGAVSEMSAEKAGDVELRAKLDDKAPVEVAGTLNLFAPNLVLHLRGSAREIALSPFSPYSVKYAGYEIERGTLSLNVRYDVENRQLRADNRISLDQFTFGERVESPTATQLPVPLAVGLLKDPNGVIDVNLPISGSLDDPQFNLGDVIARVAASVIVKAVTAPFALLGSLFGGGAELAYVEFAPGSAELPAAEQAKLKHLATALAERPGLRLDVSGRAMPEPDREGLKRAAMAGKVRAQKFEDLRRSGKAPASAAAVSVGPEEYEKYLRRAYAAEKFPKPRNALGFAKELPVAEMEDLMLTHTPVEEDDLLELANERAQAAKEWLVEEAKVPAERVFVVAPKLGAKDIKDSGRPTRVDFGLR
jgi:uncharacterized protein involved in outer membrane biogenesis